MSAEPVAMNPLQAIRTIRACESEAAAQLRLEHYASVVRAMAIAEAARECEETYPEYRGNGVMEYLPCYSTPRECAAAIRALSSPPSVSEEWIAKIINSIPGGVNSEDCYSVVRATLAALGVEVKS